MVNLWDSTAWCTDVNIKPQTFPYHFRSSPTEIKFPFRSSFSQKLDLILQVLFCPFDEFNFQFYFFLKFQSLKFSSERIFLRKFFSREILRIFPRGFKWARENFWYLRSCWGYLEKIICTEIYTWRNKIDFWLWKGHLS